METYKVNSIEDIDKDLVVALIKRHEENEVQRILRLKRYYEAESDIKFREMNSITKPNNQVAHSYPAYITDTVLGYFIGKPINYNSGEEELMTKFQDILDNTHEQSHNTKIAKNMSICGEAYELVYLDDNGGTKLSSLEPEECFIVYDSTVERRELAGIRYYGNVDYKTSNVKTTVEVYDDSSIKRYSLEKDLLTLISEERHFFGKVPMVRYTNNEEATGDFEKVIDLIDAYDKGVSDTCNNLEYFADAYMHFKGVILENESEDILTMKENRAIFTEPEADIKFLLKPSNIEESEALKSRLREDIHNLSQVPNLNDDSFGNATSGEGLKYKLFGLENMVAKKERMFSESLEKRNELITSILNLRGGSYNHTDIVAVFTRNLPSNNIEITDMVVKLQGIVPLKTRLSWLPLIDDPEYQIELLKEEQEGTLLGYEELMTDEL